MKRKIKIFSLATTYPESLNSSLPKFVHALNKALVDLGIDVQVITPHSKEFSTKQTMDGVKIKRFRYLPENMELNYISIAEELKKSKFGTIKIFLLIIGLIISTITECIKEKPDIIHGQWAFPGGYAAYFVSKLFGAKSIISVHGGEYPLLKKFRFLQKPVVNSLNNSAIVIVNSNYSRDELEKMGVRKEKIVRINPVPNFSKHCFDNDLLQKFRQEIVNENQKLILFCGRLTERKGVEYLIKSIPKIKTKNVHLIIVGGGSQENSLKQLTSTLQLEDNITFFGRADDEKLGFLRDISDVFVCPSIIDSQGETEGLGLVIPEAMESGLPVIGTTVGGIPDVIKNGINGILIEQKDPTAIAKAIDEILQNPDFTKKIVENSKETVKEFSPELIAKRHLEIFQKLIS